jgi:hypothetical protein
MSKPLPPDILAQIDAIKQAQLDNLAKSLPLLHSPGDIKLQGKRRKWKGLQAEVKAAVARMRKANYSTKVVRKEIRWLSQGHYAKARQIIVRQVEDAVYMADRYADLMDYYQARERIKGFGKGRAELVNARDRAFLSSVESLGSAESAVAWSFKRRQKLESDAARTLRGSVLPATDGSGNLSLSGRLHGSQTANSRTLGAIVERGIREGHTLDQASRELIDMVAKSGGKIAGDKELPKLIKELRKAGANLAEGGGKAAQAQWDRTIGRIQRYTRNLAPGGTVRSGYVQLLEEVNRGGPKAVDKAVNNWMYRYQKFAAERIANTEAQTAYRLRQIEQDSKKPWIESYIWRMNAAVHARYVSYTKLPKSGKRKGKGRCDCEIWNGQRVTREWVSYHPQGLHPNCACRAVPIINRGILEDSPINPASQEFMGRYAKELGLD